MQFLFSVIDDTAGRASADQEAAIDAFNDQLRRDGRRVFAGGLAAPSEAVLLDNRHDRGQRTDGPFAETSEHVAGLWIIEAPSATVAVELATAASKACDRKIEVRAFL